MTTLVKVANVDPESSAADAEGPAVLSAAQNNAINGHRRHAILVVRATGTAAPVTSADAKQHAFAAQAATALHRPRCVAADHE